jgi:hypothetical protein
MNPLLLGPLFEIGKNLIDRLIPDPAAKAAATLELAKLQESGELARMANETKITEAFMADTQSARDREAKIATSAEAPYINKVIGPYLAISILGGAVILFICMIFGIDETVGTAQKEIMLYILGVLSSLCTQVCSYFFGSSRGDAAKDQHLREIMKNGHG